jgi:hypothetical protein
LNSIPDFESERVVNDGTARGNANSSTSLCKFHIVDVLGVIGSAFAEAEKQPDLSPQQEWQVLASLAQAG